MRKFFPLIAVAFFVVSCKTTPADKLAFSEIKKTWDFVCPEYVQMAEKTFTGEALEQRVKLAGDLSRLLKEKTEAR